VRSGGRGTQFEFSGATAGVALGAASTGVSAAVGALAGDPSQSASARAVVSTELAFIINSLTPNAPNQVELEYQAVIETVNLMLDVAAGGSVQIYSTKGYLNVFEENALGQKIKAHTNVTHSNGVTISQTPGDTVSLTDTMILTPDVLHSIEFGLILGASAYAGYGGPGQLGSAAVTISAAMSAALGFPAESGFSAAFASPRGSTILANDDFEIQFIVQEALGLLGLMRRRALQSPAKILATSRSKGCGNSANREWIGQNVASSARAPVSRSAT